MKKWAAQAVAAVMLFDLIAGPPYVLLAQPSIEPGDVLMWAFDVVMLLLLASAWHTVSRAR
jgi:hypothetical protein